MAEEERSNMASKDASDKCVEGVDVPSRMEDAGAGHVRATGIAPAGQFSIQGNGVSMERRRFELPPDVDPLSICGCIADAMPTGVAVIGRDRKFAFVNSAAAELANSTPERLYGTPVANGLGIPGSFAALVEEAAETALYRGARAKFLFDDPDSPERRVFDCDVLPVGIDCGMPLYALLVINDVTGDAETREALKIQRDLAAALCGLSDAPDVYEVIFDAFLGVQGIEGAGLYLLRETDGAAFLTAHRGMSRRFVDAVDFMSPDSAPIQLLSTGKALYFGVDDAIPELKELYRNEKLRFIAVVPIIDRKCLIGCLNLASRSVADFKPAFRSIIESAAAQIGSTLARIGATGMLRRSEARYRGIVDSAVELIVRINAEGRITFVNEAFCETFGSTFGRLFGTRALMHLAVEGEWRTILDKLTHPPRRCSFTGYASTSAGRRWFRWEAVGIAGPGDRVTEYQAAGRDITEDRIAAERQQVFQLALQSSSDIVMLLDPGFRITFLNRACAAALDIPENSAPGLGLARLLEDFHARFPAEMPGAADAGGWSGIIDGYRRDRRRLHLRAAVSAVRNENDTVSGYLLVGRDITDEVLAAEKEQDNRLFAAVGRVSSMIAHDLKTPLTSITLNVDMMADELGDRPEYEKSFGIIKSELLRLQKIVRRGLTLNEAAQISREPVPLRQLVECEIHALRSKAGRKGIALHNRLPDVRVTGDRELLVSVFRNLLDNGIEAIERNGTVVVTGRYANGTGMIECFVTDSGCGISDASNLFRPFRTTKEGGSGLGLATAHKVCELHGGGLALQSSRPGLTVFRVTLPLAEDEK